MNKAKLKTYAPQARKDFIAAVTARAHRLGLAENNGQLQIAPAEKSGDLVVIAGQFWPAKISRQRDNLIALIQKHGFDQTMENVAYTWFNRFAALRYMEIHDYLTHGYRVLSNRAGGLPEILGSAPELAQHGDLPGLTPERAIELKLAGDQDGELYRLTLIAQCNSLSNAMPFLFERIDDETELLLPDNLLLTDSVVAKLVEAIPEEDWSQVEIIGWLYQFYISEKKDQVIGKVVKSEDIPAATQLFTPNWIVQYLLQNSVGRLWLMANPTSTLKSQWPYYIEPAEQTPEVQAQLDSLIQARMAEDGGSLNPETITVLDPACGSGHILVEAYEVLKAIYLERGYQPRSIPRLILEKNLFGLDIDDRAAQLAGFALLMKARADDRRLLDNPPKLNLCAIQSTKSFNLLQLWQQLDLNRQSKIGSTSSLFEEPQIDIGHVIDDSQYQLIKHTLMLFEQAETIGSFIQVSHYYAEPLKDLLAQLQGLAVQGYSFQKIAAITLLPIIQQAVILGMQFDAVVANPPYMGGKGMNVALKDYAKRAFPDSKSDLFAMFIERGFGWCKPTGFNSMVTMQSWMFLSSFESMRQKLLSDRTIITMAHLGARAFSEISGEVVQTTAFVLLGQHLNGYKPVFFRLVDGQEADKKTTLQAGQNRFNTIVQDDFKKVPGSPLAYWAAKGVIKSYQETDQIYEISISDGQNITANNDRFLRNFWEVSCSSVNKKDKWVFYAKGGGFRKWYGNMEMIVDWSPLARAEYRRHPSARIIPEYLWFKEGVTWTLITSAQNSFRVLPEGSTFDKGGSSIFFKEPSYLLPTISFLNSKVCDYILKMLSSTLNLQVDEVRRLPFDPRKWLQSNVTSNASLLIEIHRNDDADKEETWSFRFDPFITLRAINGCLSKLHDALKTQRQAALSNALMLETENNRLFIEAYGLQDELSPEVPEDQITLTRADRQKDCQRLISYAIGCIMGRYSLDEPGLIYAHAGNVGFDSSRYNTFPADADGIVPITDELWFEDDAANRIRGFLLAVWGAETLDENLAWLAESLRQKVGETPEETIRRYLVDSFFKDHLQTYKKRPIYWLFSSGKQGAFQALVYLHRYHEGTLARMRAEYVVPLTGKIQSRIEMLEKDAAAAPSNAARNKLSKDIEKLKKKHVELLAYDEKLRHYADLRIQLDLDDGVKVNYGKFGDLLAEVKAVTGGASDD
jgi:type II restriction/modification system DNA methylase subunit YeeA